MRELRSASLHIPAAESYRQSFSGTPQLLFALCLRRSCWLTWKSCLRAISSSQLAAQGLVAFFQEYYRSVPIPGTLAGRFKQIPPFILQRRNGDFSAVPTAVGELQSIAIVKEMIAVVYKDWTSGRLHAYEKCRRSCASPSTRD